MAPDAATFSAGTRAQALCAALAPKVAELAAAHVAWVLYLSA